VLRHYDPASLQAHGSTSRRPSPNGSHPLGSGSPPTAPAPLGKRQLRPTTGARWARLWGRPLPSTASGDEGCLKAYPATMSPTHARPRKLGTHAAAPTLPGYKRGDASAGEMDLGLGYPPSVYRRIQPTGPTCHSCETVAQPAPRPPDWGKQGAGGCARRCRTLRLVQNIPALLRFKFLH
jgi:hypothetical protein